MSARHVPVAIFRLGRVVATPGVLARLSPDEILRAIQRHQAGDWGDLDEHDRCANESALSDGGRILSVYVGLNGTRFYVITESDRSVTTVLLPSEY